MIGYSLRILHGSCFGCWEIVHELETLAAEDVGLGEVGAGWGQNNGGMVCAEVGADFLHVSGEGFGVGVGV